MRRRFKHLPAVLALVFLTAACAGCNIFGFVSDKEETPVQKAEQAIRDGDYAKAKKELTTANGALTDSTDSMVLYTYSKAVLLGSGISIARFVDLIQAKKGATSTGDLALLSEIDKLNFQEQTAWYQANLDIAVRLARIWNKLTTGEMSRDDIALDYSVSNILGGVLSLRDTNRDKVIDNRDFQINLAEVSKVISGDAVKGFDFSGITSTDAISGKKITYDGLTAFLGSPIKTPRTAKPAGVFGYTPDDINPLIATVLAFLDGGQESIDYFVQNLAKNTSYDAEDIKKYIPEVARIINFYWYDDGQDNDLDGRKDEEEINGKDDDGDGLIDEDSHYMKDYDTTNTRNTQYIPVWEKWKRK